MDERIEGIKEKIALGDKLKANEDPTYDREYRDDVRYLLSKIEGLENETIALRSKLSERETDIVGLCKEVEGWRELWGKAQDACAKHARRGDRFKSKLKYAKEARRRNETKKPS